MMKMCNGGNVLAVCLLLCNICSALHTPVHNHTVCDTHVKCSLGVGQLYEEAVYTNIADIECDSITSWAILHYRDGMCKDAYMNTRRTHMLERCRANPSRLQRNAPVCIQGTYEGDESVIVGVFIALAVLIPRLSR